ncbi:SAM-dependent methyltransferase [Bradyrhizobium sp. BRP20]|nr:SAM-dependent methyltransferase [Bradyrhizobium sp. BRP20]MCA1498972.1 SAM-dependent methyltransferase [Bradyrhizobium sp. NBAIM14]MCA1549413.1 SAM-dependent methyltransferase [Bradyrhizobium sp. BRP19]
MTEQDICIRPVATVRSSRKTPEDDHWGAVESYIDLDQRQFGANALLGLSEFSHVEVVFLMHKVPPDSVEKGARHPRERADWPLVGIYAQRGKSRPNRLGVSRCALLGVWATHSMCAGWTQSIAARSSM